MKCPILGFGGGSEEVIAAKGPLIGGKSLEEGWKGSRRLADLGLVVLGFFPQRHLLDFQDRWLAGPGEVFQCQLLETEQLRTLAGIHQQKPTYADAALDGAAELI